MRFAGIVPVGRSTVTAPVRLRVAQVCTGLGAGNIGDELMARAFWKQLPLDVQLVVSVLHQAKAHRASYPCHHCYRPCDRLHTLLYRLVDLVLPLHIQAALIVGTTPVTEVESLGQLKNLAHRLLPLRRRGLPVDAIGVGVDHLYQQESIRLFHDHVRPVVRSWTVRSVECRDALLSLEVHPAQILVTADWAWLYRPETDQRDWAAHLWRQLGIDLGRPLLVANLVNLNWIDCIDAKRNIATALERIAHRYDAQIAFFCNDFRRGPLMDCAAARDMAARMHTPAVFVPPEYYSADETLALLCFAQVTVGQRYHFIVQSVLAGSIPVAIPRLEKMAGLVRDLGCPASGSIDHVDADALVATLSCVLENRLCWRSSLEAAQARLTRRAEANLDFIWRLPPYDQLRGTAPDSRQVITCQPARPEEKSGSHGELPPP